jgi:hypothetical protein
MFRIKGNAVLLDYLRSDMLSRVPDHPLLALLPSNPQGSLTPLAESLAGRVDRDQTSTSTSNEGAQPRPVLENSKKRKTHTSDEPDSYEVEEICGHRQDNQARKSLYQKQLKKN